MIELRWVDDVLQYRTRGFEVDASMAFCGLTDFGPWRNVPKIDFFSDRELSVEEAASLKKAGIISQDYDDIDDDDDESVELKEDTKNE